MNVTGPWSSGEATEFLRAATIPVRLACRTPADDLWMLSLWYEWTDEGGGPVLRCATGADADVVRFLRRSDGVAFEVSTNDPPYRGVRGRGTASVVPDEDKALLRSLFERYLGGTENALGDRLLSPDREEVRIVVEPTRLHTWDFSGRMPEAGEADRPD
jgi:nitroimidazol reductase NimA-like FMN-containing flavoprotein (pyridoxamine 5'-phosphate oxidase superfamily)